VYTASHVCRVIWCSLHQMPLASCSVCYSQGYTDELSDGLLCTYIQNYVHGDSSPDNLGPSFEGLPNHLPTITKNDDFQ